MFDRRQKLAEIFEDTQKLYQTDHTLQTAINKSKTEFYDSGDYPELAAPLSYPGIVHVTRRKTFEAAMKNQREHPAWKICVLNFASATRPGGGVKGGSSAQEESLCRCSTLYHSLDQRWLWQKYYDVNRAMHDNLHTDACIYSSDVIVFKSDDNYPVLLPQKDWITVDVISCAAPNLRSDPRNAFNPDSGKPVIISNEELYQLHVKRAKHILQIAASKQIDCLILGAFGCGAFENDPETVAKAYRDVLPEFLPYFQLIEFAVYCRSTETMNYNAFDRAISILNMS